ncbi:MAG: nitrous oxide reductase family maturation protein NosD [Terriglobales bacterium]
MVSVGISAQARTLTVAPGTAISSVRDALAQASPGDTIEVRGGVHEGNFLLDRRIKLIGLERPVLRGNARGSVITVTADGCEIRGFVIERSGSMLVDEDSGILLRSSGNIIEGNELRDVLYGIYLLAANRNRVAGNTIRGRPLPDLGSRGSGIHIWNASDNLLEGNRITTARDGIYFQNAYRTTVRHNEISDLRYGLHYMFSDDNVFEDNLSHHNVAGAAIMYSKRIQFRRNAFLHNRGFSSFGILFQDTEHCVAEDNIVSNNGVGIFMEALRNSTVRRNLVSANDLALQIFHSASNNIFEQNNFVENLSPIEVIGGRTSTAWSGSAGNYWSDYEGYDLDGDSVGDVPHRIYNVFQYLEGNYPRLRIYFYSPAAQALALAERGFPVFQRKAETDERPLMRPVALSTGKSLAPGRRHFSGLSFAAPSLMLICAVVLFRRGSKR